MDDNHIPVPPGGGSWTWDGEKWNPKGSASQIDQPVTPATEPKAASGKKKEQQA
jgi:hypothetical protein